MIRKSWWAHNKGGVGECVGRAKEVMGCRERFMCHYKNVDMFLCLRCLKCKMIPCQDTALIIDQVAVTIARIFPSGRG